MIHRRACFCMQSVLNAGRGRQELIVDVTAAKTVPLTIGCLVRTIRLETLVGTQDALNVNPSTSTMQYDRGARNPMCTLKW